MRYRFIRFPEGRAKALTLSYDDGCPEDIRFADLLADYGIKCTFNFNTNASRGEKALATEVVNEHILGKGHEIAVHGEFHKANGTIRTIEGIREVLNCRLELEERCGRIIRGMAYPNSGIRLMTNLGTYEQIKQYLTELDIAYARSLGGDNNAFQLPVDFHNWIPSAHHKNPSILEYVDDFLAIDLKNPTMRPAIRYPRLLYVWGHAYEFDTDNNWELIEEICQKLTTDKDIWFATNIEFYDYVTAYKRLEYSADGKRIHNPSAITVWLDVGGEIHSIAPGETIKVEL